MNENAVGTKVKNQQNRKPCC